MSSIIVPPSAKEKKTKNANMDELKYQATEEDEKDFIRALNQIDIIQTAYAIDPYSLKSRDNFLIF